MPEIIGGKWKTLRIHVGIIPQIDQSEGVIFFNSILTLSEMIVQILIIPGVVIGNNYQGLTKITQ